MKSLSKSSPLFAEMAKAGLMTDTLSQHKTLDRVLDAIEDSAHEKLAIPAYSPRNKKSTMNYG